MDKYWSKLALGIEPYVPGEQPKDKKYVKLNTNENPYGPSTLVVEAIKSEAGDSLKLYPDPTCGELILAAADYYNVNPECIFPGNGSDEVLAFAFMAFFDPGREILFADITYSFYPVYSKLFNLKTRIVPLDANFGISANDYFNSEGGVVIANPNAPTSKAVPLRDVKTIIEENPETVVILDEAYIDFGGESAVELIEQHPNLLVVQTLSKSRSLAGMRIGFAIGNKNLIEAMNAVKNSFNSYTLDRLAIKAGVAAFKDEAYFEKTKAKIMKTRDRVVLSMREMGFSMPEPAANFIFAAHPVYQASELFRELRERGCLVRHFNKKRIDNYLRISIGSDEEMDFFLSVLSGIIEIIETRKG